MTDRSDQQKLPDILARIADAAGEEAALLVAKAFGGRPLYIPLARDLDEDHRLARLVGIERARAICRELGRGDFILPRGPFSSIEETKRRVAEMLAQKKSHASIALAMNLHIRTVEKIASRLRGRDDRQGSLL